MSNLRVPKGWRMSCSRYGSEGPACCRARAETTRGQINAGDVEAACCQAPGVATASAAKVKRLSQMALGGSADQDDRRTRRPRPVAVRIQAVIVRGVKPGREPFRRGVVGASVAIEAISRQ